MREIEEIMTDGLITICGSAPLLEAYTMMQERNIRHLFVQGESGRVAGIISDRDLQRAMIPREPSSGGAGFETLEFDPRHRVKDFMSFPVRSVREDCTIQDVAQTMLQARVSALLVVGKDARPKGVVTTDDFLRFVANLPPSSGGIALDLKSLLLRHADLGYLT